jgi:Holliday junction resolvase RusA-like endonuclease
MKVSFEIPGRIGGKGRHRSTIIKPKGRAPFISHYTPAETREMEMVVRNHGREAMGSYSPLEGPIWLDVRLILIPPESWSIKRKAHEHFVATKPDLDNIQKLIGDALNGVCWKDDAQIAALFFLRTYDVDGPEKVVITFGDLTGVVVPIERPSWAPKDLPLFQEARAA